MKIKKYVTVSKQVEVILDVLCNMCGETMLRGSEGYKEVYGLEDISYIGGYDSGPAIKDEDHLKFSLCENCLGSVISQFKIPASLTWALENGLVNNLYRKGRDEEYQDHIQKIYAASSKDQLAHYLVDNDPLLRQYASLRLEQLLKIDKT